MAKIDAYPEDSMGGHMHNGQKINMRPNMQGKSPDMAMPNMNENQMQQHQGKTK